jgi:hypothetical protein
MNELLELAVAAHGGLDRWHSYRSVSLELPVGGVLWELKGQAGLFANATYDADTPTLRATLGRFGAPGVSSSHRTDWFWKRIPAR